MTDSARGAYRSEPYGLPIFPLGAVALPTAPIPLHVFEPRYRQLVSDVVAGDGCFGIVLIERGPEVGGGDVRSDVGTRVRIADTHAFDDGRSALVAVGEAVFDVVGWLADDPYPRSVVEERDPAQSRVDDPENALFGARLALLDIYELAVDLGRLEQLPAVEWDDEPETALWQLCVAAPIGPADQHELLVLDSCQARVAKITELLEEIRTDLHAERKFR